LRPTCKPTPRRARTRRRKQYEPHCYSCRLVLLRLAMRTNKAGRRERTKPAARNSKGLNRTLRHAWRMATQERTRATAAMRKPGSLPHTAATGLCAIIGRTQPTRAAGDQPVAMAPSDSRCGSEVGGRLSRWRRRKATKQAKEWRDTGAIRNPVAQGVRGRISRRRLIRQPSLLFRSNEWLPCNPP
jgi:hypothetical protein